MKKDLFRRGLLGLLIILMLAPIAEASNRKDKKNQKKEGKIDPSAVTIVRDEWGVPHIYATKDAQVAFGLAWANAEDDFATMQELIMAAKGTAGRHLGKDGAKRDFLAHAIGLKEMANNGYETKLSDDFKTYLDGYVQGINAYAEQHPDEVLCRKTFPLNGKDLIRSTAFGLSMITGVHKEIGKIIDGTYDNKEVPLGSNAFAINSTRTTDESTLLVINPHQPMEGPLSWYEAHLCSEEGLNIIGAMFPGGTSIFLGTNEHLGWAHTMNSIDAIDVFKLETNEKRKMQYKFDGEWVKLEKRRVVLKVKITEWLTLPVVKTTYWSKYGATVKSKEKNFYSMKFAANEEIRCLEQVYRMNKARNIGEFTAALKMEAHPRYNIIYADKEDNIFFLGNGLIPVREHEYDWKGVVPGNTSKTLWTKYHPLENRVMAKNPRCGYVFNTNNSPFNCTAANENPKREDFALNMGYDEGENNRSERFMELIKQYNKISFEDAKAIKFDNCYPDTSIFLTSIKKYSSVDPLLYPDISNSLVRLNNWDGDATMESKEAGLMLFTYQYIFDKIGFNVDVFRKGFSVADSIFYNGVRYAQNTLIETYNSVDVTLGEIQKIVRGDNEYPLNGFPDAMASNYSVPYKDGKVKVIVGDSYVQCVRFNKNLKYPEIESLLPYGSSAHPNSIHFSDQMSLYSQQKTKKMSLDKEEVFKKAELIYHPR